MKLITLFLVLSSYGWAAISANTVWEVRTAGTDTNGGGFVTGAAGTDWSLFNNKNASGCTSCGSTTDDLSVTDGVTAGTTTITSATANFQATIVGNIIYVQGGTGSITAGWYQVTARASTTSITVDRSTGLTTGTGVTLNIGGALASPGQASVNASVAGNIVFIKYNASAFSVTSASTGAAGVISNNAGAVFSGYDSTRTACNSDSNRPTLQINVSTATLITGGTSSIYCSLILDGNSQTSAKSFAAVQGYRLHVINFNTVSTGTVSCVYCSATLNSAAVFVNGLCLFTEAYANTATPFSGVNCYSCISRSNTGASTDGYSLGSGSTVNSVAYANGRDGFSTGAASVMLTNNVAESNGRYGYIWGSTGNKLSVNNAAYNNTTSATNGTSIAIGFITVTAGSVFVDASTSNFALNNTVNQGASLRNAGFPTAFPVATTSTYLDIGVARHQDPVGSSGGGAFGYVK